MICVLEFPLLNKLKTNRKQKIFINLWQVTGSGLHKNSDMQNLQPVTRIL